MKKERYVAIIDDDHDDVMLLEECFQKFHFYSIHSFNRGAAFFDFLNIAKKEALCLLVVDLNIPEMGGVEIIKTIKENQSTAAVPVLVFTTGGTPSEMAFCNAHHIHVFKKPSSLQEWESIALAMASHCDPSLSNMQ
jgi:response regulator RpfG family c-di-GMP phosphodiesterase